MMPSKFATHSFQAFAQNEIGYMPSSPKCKDCSRHKMIDGLQDREWLDTCNILGDVGLMIVKPEGCCRHHEPKRVGCVSAFEKEPK